MKAWEETWEVRRDEGAAGQHRPGDVFLVGAPRAVLRPFGNARYREGVTADDRAKLAAAAPEMARLLRQLHTCQGSWIDIEDRRRIEAVLAKAGVVLEEEEETDT